MVYHDGSAFRPLAALCSKAQYVMLMLDLSNKEYVWFCVMKGVRSGQVFTVVVVEFRM